MTGISVRAAGVRFAFDRQQRVVTPAMERLRRLSAETWGLHSVDLELVAGESLALLGPSGSGKTTLLRLLAGVLVPDVGEVVVRGRVASLLSVDAGLMGPLTGRENAVLLGVLAGLSRRAAIRAAAAVRDRAGVGDAFDRPVAAFSQGMRARLSFAVAERTEPSVLLLDEVHEALDHEFRAIVERRAHELLAAGGIVVCAGHDHELLERICTRGALLRHGRVVADGPLSRVRATYVAESTPEQAG